MKVSLARISPFSVLNPPTKEFGDLLRQALCGVGVPHVMVWGGQGESRSYYYCGPGSSVGITTELPGWKVRDRFPVGTRFSARPDRPCGPASLLYNRYRVFPGGKVRPGRAADHSPTSSAAVMEE